MVQRKLKRAMEVKTCRTRYHGGGKKTETTAKTISGNHAGRRRSRGGDEDEK